MLLDISLDVVANEPTYETELSTFYFSVFLKSLLNCCDNLLLLRHYKSALLD